tara:strand:- start:192 stop:743 length:552 start_codon:yes stop_codon:yes gene_type:complete
MWKISLLILTFFFPHNAYAGLEGLGDIKLSPYSVDQLEKYLSDDVKNKKAGAKQRGTGLVFSISADGKHSGFYYCFQGKSCTPNEVNAKKHCETKAKKRGSKVKCNTFAIQRKIVWNNVNRAVPKNMSVKEFINKLGPNSGITISDAKPRSNLDSEQKKQLKSLLDAGIMTKKEYEEALKQIK